MASRASQSTKQEEVGFYAHVMAQNRDRNDHGEDEADDP
jgi:hypothetical protein